MSVAHPDVFFHDVLFFDTTEELLDVTVPFLAEGLDLGEAAIVFDAGRNGPLVADAVADARLTRVRREPHQRPARTLALFQRTVEEALGDGAAGVRITGDVGLPVHPDHWSEWVRFEVAFTEVMGRYPVQTICTWNTPCYSEEALRTVTCTHPSIVDVRGRRANPDRLDAVECLRRYAVVAADPLEAAPATLTAELYDLADLDPVRRDLHDTLARLRVPLDVVREFVVATNEVMTNGLRHGCPPVRLSVWHCPQRIVGVVVDQGPGFDDPLAGYRGIHDVDLAGDGMGLWLARQLCDRLDLIPGRDHFTARLTVNL